MKVRDQLLLGLAVGVTAAGHARTVAARPAVPHAPVAATVAAAYQGRNSISGMVYGEGRRPLTDIYVELLNELDITINRTKTTSGRFQFPGLSEGRFKVRVIPIGLDYQEHVEEVVIANISAIGGGTGGESKQVDIYLRPRPAANSGPFAAPGTVFAQEVPEEARKLFEKGVGELRAKKEKEGFESLRQAIAAFPDYYQALDRLGTEYAVRGNANPAFLQAAQVLLSKAVQVNPNSFSSTFGLGFTQYHLGQTDKAVETFQRAVGFYDKSPNGYLWLGIAQKKAGKLQQAEESLVKANKLAGGKAADVHWQLAGVYSDQKRYREAADELEQFLKAQPEARDSEKIRQLIAQLRQKAGAPTP